MERISTNSKGRQRIAELRRLTDEIGELRDELLATHGESKWMRKISDGVEEALASVWDSVSESKPAGTATTLYAKARRALWNAGNFASSVYTNMTWARVALATVVLLAAIFTLDLWTGQVVAFRLMYVLPIWLAARLGGTGAGVFAMALVGSLSTFTDAQFSVDSANYAMNFFVRWIGLGGVLITILHVESALKIARQQATSDPLTGLANRQTIHDKAEQTLARRKGQAGTVHVAIVDCDNFKRLNDANGHAFGDHALKVLSRRLEWATKETGSVARLGGDEFLVIFEGVTRAEANASLSKANNGYRKIMASLGCKATMSFGLATYNVDGDTLSELCRVADERMYEGKKSMRRANLAVVQARAHASQRWV